MIRMSNHDFRLVVNCMSDKDKKLLSNLGAGALLTYGVGELQEAREKDRQERERVERDRGERQKRETIEAKARDEARVIEREKRRISCEIPPCPLDYDDHIFFPASMDGDERSRMMMDMINRTAVVGGEPGRRWRVEQTSKEHHSLTPPNELQGYILLKRTEDSYHVKFYSLDGAQFKNKEMERIVKSFNGHNLKVYIVLRDVVELVYM